MRALFRLIALAALCVAALAHAGNPANPILFVTQVPLPEEVVAHDVTQSFMSTVSPFSNHLANTAHAGRGGSLFVRFASGQVVDLLAAADWSAIPGGKPAADSMAVRNPAVHFDAGKAIFSMTYGKPADANDHPPFIFQLFEITLPTQVQLNANVKPVLTLVANQPPYNNVFPTYAASGRIAFVSDRPYNGQPHLTQREEYLSLPTTSGLWSLDPANAASLRLLHHAPSGAFHPSIDNAGRLIFSNWDHLARDPSAVYDSRPPDPGYPSESWTQTSNGSGNFADESIAAPFTPVTAMFPNTWDTFPEPRNFDAKTLQTFYPNQNGNAFNVFMPWMLAQDGTGGELLNHVGRHEISAFFKRTFTNDAALLDFDPATAPSATNGNWGIHNFTGNFFAPREDPLNPGTFYGADAPERGTHTSGRIIRIGGGGPGQNPDAMTVANLTAFTAAPTVRMSISLPPTGQTALANGIDLYRTPVPLADGNLVVSRVAGVHESDYNAGTLANPLPVSGWSFRLVSMKPPPSPGPCTPQNTSGCLVADVTLTAGITINTDYYANGVHVAYNGPAWELDPVEVVARAAPAAPPPPQVHPVTVAAFTTANVHLPTFQSWLDANDAALSVSFDVTKRDFHDTQQPYNLRVSWSGHATTKNAGTLYDIAWMRFFQADLRRGYLLGGATPAPGRRVVATPLHDTMAHNIATPGAPAGSVRIGDDGSVAAIVPAGKALTWEMLDNDAPKTSQVKERFWVTFQKGEIRTCTNCHGINTKDQTGTPGAPSNPPAALAALLTQWKAAHPAGLLQFVATVSSAVKTAGTALVAVSRTGGATGPVSVQYATANGSAVAGVDYTAVSGTLNWATGDTAAKTISVPLLGNPIAGPSKTVNLMLSAPAYGTLGAQSSHALTILDQGVTPAGPLDVDGDGAYDALTDGMLVLRYMRQLTGSELIAGARGPNATRDDTQIKSHLDGLLGQLDLDLDGVVDPNSDGMMILRYLFGFRGAAITAGAFGPSPQQTSEQIETSLQSLTP